MSEPTRVQFSPEMALCNACHQPLSRLAASCPHCGHPGPNPPPPAPNPVRERMKREDARVTFMVWFIPLCLIALLVWFLTTRYVLAVSSQTIPFR